MMKDVPTWLSEGTDYIALLYLPQEDTSDAFIRGHADIQKIEDLPDGSVIGTSSLRLNFASGQECYSTLKCVHFRGNVQTILRAKLNDGVVDATLLY
jgi:porphobilinogen deaminase